MRKRPSRLGYWIGAAIFVLAVVGGITLVSFSASSIADAADSPRIPVPGEGSVTLEAGDIVLYAEPDTTRGRPPVDEEPAGVRITGPDGERVPIQDYPGSSTYRSGDDSGRAFATLRAPVPGNYRIVTRPGEDPDVEAVSFSANSGIGSFFAGVFGGIVLMVLGIIVSIVVVVVTAILRYLRNPARARPGGGGATEPRTAYGGEARYGPAGPASGAGGAGAGGPVEGTPTPGPTVAAAPAAPAANWYADPYGQARLRYWDGARWTEHTSA